MPEWILDGGSATLDLRVGGKYHMDMHYEGKSYPHDGEYLEIVPPERLVFTWISEATNWLPCIVTIEFIARGERDRDGADARRPAGKDGRRITKAAGWRSANGWSDCCSARRSRLCTEGASGAGTNEQSIFRARSFGTHFLRRSRAWI